jgi:hypothetical protein
VTKKVRIWKGLNVTSIALPDTGMLVPPRTSNPFDSVTDTASNPNVILKNIQVYEERSSQFFL